HPGDVKLILIFFFFTLLLSRNLALLVRLSLNRSLQLCVNETECCARPLCVAETVQVSACRGEDPLASLIVQAQIYALLPPAGPVSENKTVIPNQVFQPLGRCPCDLTPGECDVRCCCDQDCTPELLWLFTGHCLPGPFGGSVTPAPEYDCSSQSAENAPDWFPFLCVNSPTENSPFLGLFYHGQTITPKAAPSFQAQQAAAPVPPTNYRQGDPIFTTDNQYFTIPQVSMVGQCVENAPVAFLQDFESVCTRTLQDCPAAPADLAVSVRNGLGVGDGLCSSAGLRPVLYGLNSTSGCLIPVRLLNLTQYLDILLQNYTVNVTENIEKKFSRYRIVESSVINTIFSSCLSHCRFRINFTDFDCERNDVCWPELAFPLTPYYTGEPYSQALAKGLILVFFFIMASVLGRPWRQIRQAWSNTSL
uniref:Tectonic family member 2 n=1 Tax=Astyanax mexicanus TaxID=7994 RepID=A0A8B9K158_ASTMX